MTLSARSIRILSRHPTYFHPRGEDMISLRLWSAVLSFLLALSFSLHGELDPRKVGAETFIILKATPVGPQQTQQYEANKVLIQDFATQIQRQGGAVLNTYLRAFVGLHVRMSNTLARKTMRDPRIRTLVPNGIAKTVSVESWGLDRIDQRNLPLDNLFHTPYQGTNVHAYIVDTGLRTTHKEFKDRVGEGISTLSQDPSVKDCNGHGTHTAGTVAGAKVGVAAGVIIHPVRVFDCENATTWDLIIKGIDWTIAHKKIPAVMNLSLGGPSNEAADTAVRSAVTDGITVIVAAGNANSDACQYSPGREPAVITVAATTKIDGRASFSNYGSCVDIFAPGQDIRSSYNTNDNAYANLNGTSMAAPHVTGAAALVAGLYPEASPEQIRSLLVLASTPKKVLDPRGSPNRLLFVAKLGQGPQVQVSPDVVAPFPTTVVITGSATAAVGSIVNTQWQQVKGVDVNDVMQEELYFTSPTWKNDLILSDLPVGKYQFRFTAIDSQGASNSADVSVTIKANNGD